MVGTLSHSDHDDSGWRHYLQGGKRTFIEIRTLQFFSDRFIMNQILFLENKNKIKNGPRGHARHGWRIVETPGGAFRLAIVKFKA